MMRTEHRVLLVAGSVLLLLAGTLHGVTNNEPGAVDRNYRVIAERNPFGLKPPPPPPTNTPAATQPKDEILLTGIVGIGTPRAYFMTKALAAKQPEFYSLGIDEKKNGLEVLEIDPSGKSVRVRNAGLETVMTFAANGVKAPATPAAGTPGGPGASPAPGPVAPPGMNVTPPPMNTAAAAGVGRLRTIPSRNVRTPTANFGPGGDAMAPPMAPVRDPNAPIQDAIMMELQKRANPNITFPPTPLPR
jgi:hypothetical protein